MRVIYATESVPDSSTKSMFLVGPSPRDPNAYNWRVDALDKLRALGYDGDVYIPLPRDGQWLHSYDDQVGWETEFLNLADVIVAWIPRDITVMHDVLAGDDATKALTLPAFTTNFEFGEHYRSGKMLYGRPDSAPKNRYLDVKAREECIDIHNTLDGLLAAAVDRLGGGAYREGGAQQVPLHIWKLPAFQGWYKAQVGAGNRVDGAKLLWSFRVGPTKGFTFAYILHVDVHIASEGRNKTNEFIFSRTDIATIVAYQRGATTADTTVALIREYRSPARTADGFIREIPGGSSWKPGEDPFVTMTHELEEETGLGESAGFSIDPTRLRKVGTRQLAGTLSTHQAHVFACELTDEEMEYLRYEQYSGNAHGVEDDSERTYVEVHRLGDLLTGDALDWSVLGMILTALS